MKVQPQTGRKSLQDMYQMKDFSKYIKNSQNSIIKNTINPIKTKAKYLNKHFTKEDIKKAKNTLKYAQHHWWVGKCKLN